MLLHAGHFGFHMKISSHCFAVALALGWVGCGSSGANPDAGARSSIGASSSAKPPSSGQASPSSTATSSANPEPGQPLASGISSADATEFGPPWFGLPSQKKDDVAKVINPKDETPYSGKTGTIRGRITIKGDPPPGALSPEGKPFHFPDECSDAVSKYQKLFRVGEKGALADAMVAVTEYDGFVPAKDRAQHTTLRKCALTTRTVVASFGQRIEVSNKDTNATYMPYLDGAPFRALMVAIPMGKPIKLYPMVPGHYLLRDQLQRPFLIADVFVVPYATFDVTAIDGRYEIRNVPVGKAKIDAFLPVINKSEGKAIEVKEGVNVIDLELTYDQKKDAPIPVPQPLWGDRDGPK